MYLPKHFDQSDPQPLQQVMQDFPLANLITLGPQGLLANPLPLLWLPDAGGAGRLQGHVARANPMWQDSDLSVEALALFSAGDAYISPSWYPSKQQHGKAVPTWNYITVQARGTLRIIDDRDWLRDLVGRLTAQHEQGRQTPWQVSDAPADYIDAMLRAIVGIEIEVRELTGKWKVSQNQQAANRQGVIDGLQQQGDAASMNMAEQVRAASA
ncbi:transcriptional regulator [Pokkaliibacter plantistimulans]|uniref:Transcriptional regulator n=1 Tax=Proteobacteria bacterium 228 TaxID=2083153 RepID=A0A2S5KU21_9PROT|nr:FMN-binding negative transcriptional regulator [Pokkaliibacter plantistimulans]PPC78238.1 transcriptional regulator [Pokkaliibacter plantistimulans]